MNPLAARRLKAQSQRRFTDHKPVGDPYTLASDHPSIVSGTTLFRARITKPEDMPRLLKSGHNSRKIGKRVEKGAWDGMPIFTLTLQERATCPATCSHWRDCYGNKMNWSKRIEHGPEMEGILHAELTALNDSHPQGFVVRLHVLGDFYSVDYVKRWWDWLNAFPALHVFGYTARTKDSEIGRAIDAMRGFMWNRFAIRFSDGDAGYGNTVSIDGEEEAGCAIICPAQTGKADCCATCGLCWGTKRDIAFLRH